jgi:monofunctional biosynthetic peptidoglycan transglycosylase
MLLKRLKRWWHRRTNSRKARTGTRLVRALRWGWRILLVLLVLDVFYVMTIWPDWKQFGRGTAIKSQFIHHYEERRKHDTALPPLQWIPIPGTQIPRTLRRAVIVAEDARFYEHHGIDLLAFIDAMDTNLELKEFKYGASTISQQTIKNLYFSSARNPLRKWHELILTLGMEMKVSKQRILTTYLNIAEFGEGIYGAEAAAQYYWHIPASQMNERQCVELAATLPSPKKSNPQTRSRYFIQRADKIDYWLQKQPQDN